MMSVPLEGQHTVLLVNFQIKQGTVDSLLLQNVSRILGRTFWSQENVTEHITTNMLCARTADLGSRC